jgi:hypothetical protein
MENLSNYRISDLMCRTEVGHDESGILTALVRAKSKDPQRRALVPPGEPIGRLEILPPLTPFVVQPGLRGL